MLISLRSDHREHLQMLVTQPIQGTKARQSVHDKAQARQSVPNVYNSVKKLFLGSFEHCSHSKFSGITPEMIVCVDAKDVCKSYGGVQNTDMYGGYIGFPSYVKANAVRVPSLIIVIDFCKLALEFLQNGPNRKKYVIAAQKLGIDVDTVQNCIYGLINLLVLGCKHNLSEADFRDSVLTLGFSEEQEDVLQKFYNSKRNEIRKITELGINDAHYSDLQWRFEVQVSSRSLLHQATPLITMDLCLKTQENNSLDTKTKHILLQTDPNNLVHITNELEKALTESRSGHSRKIQRALNTFT